MRSGNRTRDFSSMAAMEPLLSTLGPNFPTAIRCNFHQHQESAGLPTPAIRVFLLVRTLSVTYLKLGRILTPWYDVPMKRGGRQDRGRDPEPGWGIRGWETLQADMLAVRVSSQIRTGAPLKHVCV